MHVLKRGGALLSSLTSNQTILVPQLTDDDAEQEGFYRFLRNSRVDHTDLSAAHRRDCLLNLQQGHYLILGDTTEINLQSNVNRIGKEELGPVGNGLDTGFFIHPLLAVHAEDHCPVGLADTKIWHRDWRSGNKHERNYKSLPFEEKESYRWFELAHKWKRDVPPGIRNTFVYDREADIYPIFCWLPDQYNNFVIRASENRLIDGSKLKLFDYIAGSEPIDEVEITIRRSGQRKARTGRFELRFGKVDLCRPASAEKDLPPTQSVYYVNILEIGSNVPQGEEAVHWTLLSSHPVETVDSALMIVDYYAVRWQIEQLFRTLKTAGLDMEGSRLATGLALMKMGAMAIQAALKVHQLVYGRDKAFVFSAEIIFNEEQLLLLELLLNKYQGKTQKQKNPYQLNSIPWAAWIIARIGGHKGYQSRAKPGPIIMSRGIEKFYTMFKTFQFLQKNLYDQDV